MGPTLPPGEYKVPIDGIYLGYQDAMYRRAEYAYDFGSNDAECFEITVEQYETVFNEKTIELDPTHFIGTNNLASNQNDRLIWVVHTDRLIL